jgi:hypothetical protein
MDKIVTLWSKAVRKLMNTSYLGMQRNECLVCKVTFTIINDFRYCFQHCIKEKDKCLKCKKLNKILNNQEVCSPKCRDLLKKEKE